MTTAANAPWERLFPLPTGSSNTVELRCWLVRRQGEPLLLLPCRRSAMRDALALYPAQTPTAKTARWLLAASLRAGLRPGTEPITLRVDPQSAFLRFLLPAGVPPAKGCFALLCGNPRAPGRRFIVLAFDEAGRPYKLVKAGLGEHAMKLIRAEAAFLKSFPSGLLHAPAITGEFSGNGLEALALEYAVGKNPTPRDAATLAGLLESWLRNDRQVSLMDLPAWHRLEAVAGGHELFHRLKLALGAARLHPAVFHGDLAPWNVRVNPATQRWVVLDWERGEAEGPPGWDWFHFVIQTELLVRRTKAEKVARRIEALLQSQDFCRYAAQAGIYNLARPLALAYLLYGIDVIAPAEGAPQMRELLDLAVRRWPLA
jgi:hypothetical protein